jgi:hypothetical protein
MELLRLVQAVLIEYRHYLLLTVRQVFYRQVGTHGYDKVLNAEREVQASLSPRPATLLGDIGGAS